MIIRLAPRRMASVKPRQQIIRAGNPAPAGRPARCASDFHGGREQAVVWGTFRYSVIRGDRPDQPNIGYCGRCAHVLELVGWFQPDTTDNPGEGPSCPGS